MPVIGFLHSQSPGPFEHLAAAFRRGLRQAGFAEGQNVTIEYRWAEGRYERLPGMAADLVRRQVAVLVATGGEPAVVAAKAATSTIPIVFAIGGDPVEAGSRRQLEPPGRQYNRPDPIHLAAGGKALWPAARASSHGRHRRADRSKLFFGREPVARLDQGGHASRRPPHFADSPGGERVRGRVHGPHRTGRRSAPGGREPVFPWSSRPARGAGAKPPAARHL